MVEAMGGRLAADSGGRFGSNLIKKLSSRTGFDTTYTGVSQVLSAASNMVLAVVVVRQYGVSGLGLLSPTIAIGQIGLGVWRVGILEVALVSTESSRILLGRDKCWYALVGSSIILVVSLLSIGIGRLASFPVGLVLPALIISLGVPFDLARYQYFAAGRPSRSASLDGIWMLLLLGTFLVKSPEWFLGTVVIFQVFVMIRLMSKSIQSIELSRRLILTARRQVEGFLWGFTPAALLAPLLLIFTTSEIAGSSRVVVLFLGPLGVLYSTLAIVLLPKLSRMDSLTLQVRIGSVLALVVPACIYFVIFLLLPQAWLVATIGKETASFVDSYGILIGVIILAKSLDLPGSILTRSRSGVALFIKMRRLNGLFSFVGLPVLVLAARIDVQYFLIVLLSQIGFAGLVWLIVALNLTTRNSDLCERSVGLG